MYKVKVLGAGSIGNHLAHASRSLGWQVAICDIDPAALERARTEIYPARYGRWDESIELYTAADAPKSVYDLIVVGTPPDAHVDLAIDAIAEGPRAVLVEKPVCGPDLSRAQELLDLAHQRDVSVFVGYDHVVGRAATQALEMARGLGRLETLDVEFREHWGGIFAAHPWLDGPQDSYLGFWKRGGGASGEHSHAINLWQHFAQELGAGRVVEVTASLDYVRDELVDYDRLCLLDLRSERGLLGRVVQDVVTQPPRKCARIQADDGYVDVTIGFQPGVDRVEWRRGSQGGEATIEKTRPDDFIAELTHIEGVLEGRAPSEIIQLRRGLDTMLVVAAAHRSAAAGRRVEIDYSVGYTPDALRVA
ncbi:MAG: Gfo/Idh/MocA family protein [Myxococcota bacterium]